MSDRVLDDRAEMGAIEALNTLEGAVEYLAARGMTREQAADLVRALLATSPNPEWPRKDH